MPEGPFTYRGVLVSNADIGRNGNTQPQNHPGNNHGSIARIGEKYYIFWHRHTHGGQFSRQGCADELIMNADGTFAQAEITSCGLNNGPLPANKAYRATIACCLLGARKPDVSPLPLHPQNGPDSTIPYHTGMKDEAAPDGYFSWIENLRPGAVFGYKYLDFTPPCDKLTMTLRGTGCIRLHLDSADGSGLAQVEASFDRWTKVQTSVPQIDGVHAVYFTVIGTEDDRLACADFGFSGGIDSDI